MDLLESARNDFSQNGEDGIVEAIFARIGQTTQWCCEFGAWDGVHFSNTRSLVNDGWSALLIEADAERYEELKAIDAGNDRVIALNRMVDMQENSLDAMLAENQVPPLDLLVVDIDGHDFDIFASLEARPRVVCIEVNAGHSPSDQRRLPATVAVHNVGQPLSTFAELAQAKGYQLVAYTGNAFFVRTDAADGLPLLSPQDAYRAFLRSRSLHERRWLFHVNRGEVPPYHRFDNEWLSREALDLGRAYVGIRFRLYQIVQRLRARGR